jgi:hypothetical protein
VRSRTELTHKATLHFRDQLRAARAAALRDAEAYQQIIFVLERLGAYLLGRMANLGKYQDALGELAERCPMSTCVPNKLPIFQTKFESKYALVRNARNSALHEGAFARNLTANSVELAIVIEEALMNGCTRVGVFHGSEPSMCSHVAALKLYTTDNVGELVFLSAGVHD